MSKQTRRAKWFKIVGKFDQSVSGEVRRVGKTNYNTTTGDFDKTYIAQVCNIVRVDSTNADTEKNTKKPENAFILAFNEVLRTYTDSTWSSFTASTAVPFVPNNDDEIYFDGGTTKNFTVKNLDANDLGVYEITAK